MQRIEWLRNRYGEQLNDKLNAEGHKFSIEEVINYFASFDPTKTKKYTQWIIATYLKRGYLFEDLSKVKNTIEHFEKFNQRIPSYERDINYHNNLDSVMGVVKSFNEVPEEVITKK